MADETQPVLLPCGRCLCDGSGWDGSADEFGGWAVEFRVSLGGWRRRNFAGWDCATFMAGCDSKQLLNLLEDLPECAGCFRKCEFYLLRVRRPDDVHSEPVRRNQLCRADVGRLPGIGESAGGVQHRQTTGLYQSEPLYDWDGVGLQYGLPRHNEREQRLLGDHRL